MDVLVAVVVSGADEVLEADKVLEEDKEMTSWFIVTIAESTTIQNINAPSKREAS